MRLDILLGVNLFALTPYYENGYSDINELETEKEKLKQEFNLNTLIKIAKFQSEYVRLSDVINDPAPYLNYLNALIERDLFYCCQLEQAIGVFENEELIVYLSSETGLCHNLELLFETVQTHLETEQIEWDKFDTFHLKTLGDRLQIKYYSDYNLLGNVPDENQLESYECDLSAFKKEFQRLQWHTHLLFKQLNSKLQQNFLATENNESIDVVLPVDKGIDHITELLYKLTLPISSNVGHLSILDELYWEKEPSLMSLAQYYLNGLDDLPTLGEKPLWDEAKFHKKRLPFTSTYNSLLELVENILKG